MAKPHGFSSMYIYDDASAITIDAVDQYHSVQGFTEGPTINGVTFKVGLNGAITNTADDGGLLQCTDVAHGLDTGDYITLTGMGDVAHVGRTQVTVVDPDTFTCEHISWSSNGDTGNWQRGSCLTIDSGFGSHYLVSFSASITSSGNNKNYKFEMSKNELPLDEFVSERKVQTASDLGTLAASGIVDLISGDCLYFTVEGTTDATNLTVKHANVHITSI